MSKFSRFVQEASQRGLVSLSKLDNGQLEVSAPPPRGVDGEVARPVADGGAALTAAPPAKTTSEERGRRSRRGGRGRGRERAAREQGAAVVGHVGEDAAHPTELAAGGSDGAPLVHSATPGGAADLLAPRGAVSDGAAIGVSGERLTRDEAFALVRRAVEALVSGDDAARASDIRAKAFDLLGRDSESLSDRNFSRILRDAHDADVVDLRRRGDDYDVALAAAAPPVSDQLNAAAAARGGASGPATGTAPAAAPAVPRGLGPRGARRGVRGGRPSAPPPDLLSFGVVDRPTAGGSAIAAVSADTPTAGMDAVPEHGAVSAIEYADEAPTEAAVAPKRRRPRSRRSAAKSVAGSDGAPVKAKRPRGRGASSAKSADD
jgi:hypothetical protein